jgi:uroporphyrinogen-III decarboxylase
MNRILPQIIDQKDLDKFFSFYGQEFHEVMLRYCEAGYPALNSGIIMPPFETLCGGRGINAFFMDCYKQIDKVKAVQDIMMQNIRNQIANMPKENYTIGCWDGGWRGASNMVNQKIWDTLVWPYMKEGALLLLERGITPILHLDACWDRDLERFLELPAKKCIINPDGMTDMRKARKILGNHCAFIGDVPSQMLTVSSKEEIKDYVRRLLNDIGTEGVFIAPGCDAPACSKYENLVAIYEAAQDF